MDYKTILIDRIVPIIFDESLSSDFGDLENRSRKEKDAMTLSSSKLTRYSRDKFSQEKARRTIIIKFKCIFLLDDAQKSATG